jgi:endonuclease-3 related protein
VKQKDTPQLLLEVYRRLLRRYGPQGWWPGDGAFEVCVGAILTQNTAWGNVEKAMPRLTEAGVLSVGGLHWLPEAELAELIRSSGYFNTKARKLKAFVGHLYERYHGDLAALLARRPTEALREELLSIHGIGEETADDILLYAAGRPSFVVDAYTRRIVDRLGLRPSVVHPEPARPELVEGRRRQRDTYQAYRTLFMDALPADTALYNEYHALLVRLGKEVCRKQEPYCGGCPLQGVCETGSTGM